MKKAIFLAILVFLNINIYSKEVGWFSLQKNYFPLSCDAFTASGVKEIDSIQPIILNPANLVFYPNKSAILFSSDINTLNIFNSSIFFVYKFSSTGLLAGLSYNDLGKEDVQYIENNQEITEKVNLQKDIIFQIGYSLLITDKISLAPVFKFVTSQIYTYNANAFVVDLNSAFKIIRNSNLVFQVKNLGFATKYKEEADNLPLTILLGYSYQLKLKNSLLIELATVFPYLVNYKFLPSLGITILRNPIKVSLGYTFNKEDSNFNLSIIANIKNFEISYGILPSYYIGTSHKIAFGYKF